MRPAVTRAGLLLTRRQLRLTEQARHLLREKRAVLLRALRELAGGALEGRAELERAMTAARGALELAEAEAGPGAVRSASRAAAGEVRLEVEPSRVAGVEVPRVVRGPVGRPRAGRGYALAATPARVDQVADRFEGALDLVLDLAACELRLRRLAAEVERTTRRVNALEQVVAPRLEQERRRIALGLAEREREDTERVRRARPGRSGRRGPLDPTRSLPPGGDP